MSKELKPIGNISITQFWGGERGTCFQLTAPNEDGDINYVQLSREDIRHLFNIVEDVFKEK